MSDRRHVHGYSKREAERLYDQAQALTDLLHHDTRYPDGSHVLEAGCGTGAQTVILARNSPGARITSMDISPESLELAEERVLKEGFSNVCFEIGDLFSPGYDPGSFDHIFLCFVLEHLGEPRRALESLRPLLRDGGTITVIEGDHGSTYFHPDSVYARRAIGCLVGLQREMGGNALIGRELYPLLTGAGYRDVRVSPRMVYVDASRPDLVEGFTKLTFAAMVESVEEAVLARGMMTARTGSRECVTCTEPASPTDPSVTRSSRERESGNRDRLMFNGMATFPQSFSLYSSNELCEEEEWISPNAHSLQMRTR